VFGRLRQLGPARGPRQFGVDSVPRSHEHVRAIQELGRDHAAKVLGREGVEC
jgi:hypothetical protein